MKKIFLIALFVIALCFLCLLNKDCLSSYYFSRFVLLSKEIPDAKYDIRYYSDYNFVGRQIDGYEEPCAILTKKAAIALKEVNKDLAHLGYGLKIYDAYRPKRAVTQFYGWAQDANDIKMKQAFYPNLDKSVLFKKGYLAKNSSHSRGSTVDLTLFDLKTGEDIDMGGHFDYFDESSHTFYKNLSKKQCNNRLLLRNFMELHGFKGIRTEWWHFTLKNEPYPETYFDFPVNKKSVGYFKILK